VALQWQEYTALLEEMRNAPRKRLPPPSLANLLLTLEARVELLQKVHHYAAASKVGDELVGRRCQAAWQVCTSQAVVSNTAHG
jgi:hypothetical protein